MAMNPPRDPRRSGVLASRLRFLVRFLGLTGALAGCAGLLLLRPDRWQSLADASAGLQNADPLGRYLTLGGFATALFALLVELLAGLRVVAGRRRAVGGAALIQVGLAALLLVGVNVWSFQHPRRVDLTRDRQFTLPDEVREKLARLDPAAGETQVILYQQHRGLNDRPDPFDIEAERKVVEKVKDLIELFREVGPQFRVEVLDVAEKGYPDRLAALTTGAPELRKAIDEAPESSILIRSGKHVQRVAFAAFYRLDRSASVQHDNLVLRSAGPEPVVRRIVNVEERAPQVGVLVAHEALSSEGPVNLFTLAGARKALLAAGFQVEDVILRTPTGEPAADTLEVTKLERLQNDLDELNAEVGSLQREIRLLERLVPMLGPGKASPEALNRMLASYAEQFNPRFILVRVSDANRDVIERLFANQLAAARESLTLAREERESVAKSLSGMNLERVTQQRRVKDLRTRLRRAVGNFDLLLVVRLTLAQSGDPIVNPSFHDLDRHQAEVVREFLRAGKPVFACLGPTNMPANSRPGAPPAIKPPDELERMLAEVGILFGKRTVLYNVEKRAFAGRDENILRASKPLQVPPLHVGGAAEGLSERLAQEAFSELRDPLAALGAAPAGALMALPFLRPVEGPEQANPVEESLRLADEESGRRLDLRARFLRPVFIDPLARSRLTYRPELLTTAAATWHDEQPFSTALRPVPRFEPPGPDDPENGTLEARRRGPFTVGVAVEARLPAGWGEKDRTVRVAAVGQASLFTGPELPPGQARLLVDTCNWLVGRREQLAAAAPEWSYPRANVGEEARTLWLWGARLGLPVLCAYLGFVVLLLRRLR